MWKTWAKRSFDVASTSVALLLLSPFLLVLAALVRLKLGAPVLFLQERPGKDAKPFLIFKLRTMTDERDVHGEFLSDSQRLTPFGSWLRRTSLDELPELFNVLRGDMSLVGPRPLLTRYTEYFEPLEMTRFSIRPGITGLAQIEGRNNASWDKRIAADLRYLETCSFITDMQILLLTFWRVVRREGLQVDPGAVMLNFDEERKQRLAAQGRRS